MDAESKCQIHNDNGRVDVARQATEYKSDPNPQSPDYDLDPLNCTHRESMRRNQAPGHNQAR